MRSLEGDLEEAVRAKAAGELEAKNALDAQVAALYNARREADVLRAGAGSAKDQALAQLKARCLLSAEHQLPEHIIYALSVQGHLHPEACTQAKHAALELTLCAMHRHSMIRHWQMSAAGLQLCRRICRPVWTPCWRSSRASAVR